MTDGAKRLVTEIFEATGHKVEQDDPLVIAALFNASLIREAGAQVATEFREALQEELVRVQTLSVELEAAVNKMVVFRADPGQHKLMADSVAKLVAEMIKAETKSTIRIAWTSKILAWNAIPLSFILAIGLFAGAVFGPKFVPSLRYKVTAEERQQMQVGKRLQEVFPNLDKDTKEKVGKALSRT